MLFCSKLLGRCSSPITVSSINSSYVSFQWVRDLSNHYQVVITSNSSTAKTYQVTSSQATISYQIFGLMPFTSYTVNITGELSSCLKTITTSEDGMYKFVFFHNIILNLHCHHSYHSYLNKINKHIHSFKEEKS